MLKQARVICSAGSRTQQTGNLRSPDKHRRMASPASKYWAIIADNLSKAGWSWGCVSAIDSNGRTIWIADAHRGDGKRFVVRADEKLTAFIELESALRTGQRFAASPWLDALVH
jgi:hypothetical protein